MVNASNPCRWFAVPTAVCALKVCIWLILPLYGDLIKEDNVGGAGTKHGRRGVYVNNLGRETRK